MFPQQYLAVKAQITSAAINKINEATARLKSAHEGQAKDTEALDDVTNRFLKLGYRDRTLPEPLISGVYLHGIGWGNRGFLWEPYLRQLAKELKRPFVQVTAHPFRWAHAQGWHVVTAAIQMPNLKRLAPLQSNFYLLPEEVAYCDKTPTLIMWNFRGDAGREVMNEWRSTCKTNTQYRHLLGLEY